MARFILKSKRSMRPSGRYAATDETNKQGEIMNTIKLAVDGAHGIYQPKRFFELYPQFIDRLDQEAQAIINDPSHEQYWDVWDDFINRFEVIIEGTRWTICEDDSIFFVADTHVWDD